MHSTHQIEIVRALARRRHFGLAAKDLGVSQPALTRSLKQIEAGLGVRLFDRQGVTPTLFGEIVLKYGARAAAEFDELAREVALAKGLEVGELTIVAAPYPASISAKRAVGMMIDRHPRLRIELRLMNWEVAAKEVLAGAADVGMAELSELLSNDALDLDLLRKSQIHFFCRPGHTR
jgi:DNA-binding transcriptional LysR family regulator